VSRIAWVCFDVGEVLVDESRVWRAWSEALAVPAFTLQAVLGGCIAQDRDHREAFALVGRPDWEAVAPTVEQLLGPLTAADLYADALPTLADLRRHGWRVAVCGNQPARRRDELAAAGITAEVLTTSDHLEAEKPDRAFYDRLLAALGDPAPAQVAYVGDRVDNDVAAAAAAGLTPVWLRRGPWGRLGEDRGGQAAATVDTLAELGPVLRALAA